MTTTGPIPPQALPGASAQFIAYGREERIAHPKTGEPVTIRPQSYVSYYPEILIKALYDGGKKGDRPDLLTVEFDPTSVPGGHLRHAFSANMDIDDATVPHIRQAHANQASVAVAIEAQRKKKNSDTKAVISPLTHIHALRGASAPDGSKGPGMAEAAAASTNPRLAMIDGVATKHILTNPLEWASLTTNKDGSLPPEGWDNFAVGDTWQECGAAVKNGSAQPTPQQNTGGANVELGAMQQMIEATLRKILDEQNAASDATGSPGRPRGKFYEGKPWEPRTSDGRVNLGGYIVSAEKWAFHWAYDHLLDLAGEGSTEADEEEAWELAGAVMTFADRVQADAYGHEFEIDRASTSHREAEDWVKWVIKHQHPWSESAEGRDGWAQAVIGSALELLNATGQRVGAYLSTKAKTPPSQQKAAETVNTGPSEALVSSTIDAINRFWSNLDSLANMDRQVVEKGLDQIPVVPSTDAEGACVGVALTSRENPNAVPLRQAVQGRGAALSKASSQGQQGQQRPQGQQGQQGGSSPAPTAQQDTAPAQGQTQQGQSAPQGGDTIQGYSRPVGEVIQGVVGALGSHSVEDLHAAYNAANSQNVLGTQVFVRLNGQELTFGRNGEDQPGFTKVPLGQVINKAREIITATPAHQGQGQSQGQQAPEPAPQQDTSADPANNEQAQALADKVASGQSAAEIQAIIDEAEAGNLQTARVTVTGGHGNPVSTTLRNYLGTMLTKAQRAEAAGQ